MVFKHRGLTDEHKVRKDANGFSLEHALVVDTSRSLIQELIDFAKERRIMREKSFQTDKRRQDIDETDVHNIEALVNWNIDCAAQKMSNCKDRQLIDYKDLDCFK